MSFMLYLYIIVSFAEMPLSKSSESISFEAWCQKELSKLLEFPVGDDLVR